MITDITTYLGLINSFQDKRILVIGDFILDVYLKGTSRRLSPEAPVPVVDITERTALPGGAANTVCNLRKLGASVDFCTVIGADSDGDNAVYLLENIGVTSENIIRDPARKTIVKTRIVSGSQLVTRIDQGSEEPISEDNTRALICLIEKCYALSDAVIIPDYDKGIIHENILHHLIRLQQRYHKFIAVDSKRLHFFSTLRPSLAKPNYEEVVRLLNLPYLNSRRSDQIETNSHELYKKVNAAIIATTLDSEGSVIIEGGKPQLKYRAESIATPYVSGAGDTYLSAFVLAFCVSKSIQIGAEIATAAATLVVKKEATAFCSNAELKCYFNLHTKYISDLNDLKDICDVYRSEGKRIVFTNGCFDILHSGHVTFLHCAKELGDILIVGLNTDESIRRLKGESRPINPLTDRLQVLSALSSVNHIIAFGNENDDTPIPLISVVRPEVFCKGGDYTKDKLPEASIVEAGGGKIVFLQHIPDHSTTGIIKRIHDNQINGRSEYEIVSNLQE